MFNLELKKIFSGEKTLDIKIGENTQMDLSLLLQECKNNLKKYDEEKIKRAFHICTEINSNKLRKSGDPLYTHSLEIAFILLRELPIDDKSVIAALLHDILDRQEVYTLEDIHSEFGSDIAVIVNGVSKIETIEVLQVQKLDQIDNYYRLILSLFKDIRIMLVKIADRLHNMRTIQYLTEEGQKRMAQETMEVYVPFTNRLGLRNIKWELEDSAFKVLNRNEYYKIKDAIAATLQERNAYIESFIQPIKEKLDNDDFIKRNKIKYEITGRPKHIYSIYNKMRLYQKPIEELHDLLAVRLILNTDDDNMCFYVYGIIASIYPPVPFTFKDYISSAKSNGYQSIHTAVIGPDNKIVEIQLRTQLMHETAEKGVAAHFKYKPMATPQSVLEDSNIQNWLQSVREVIENIGNGNSNELLEEVKKKLFADQIFVLTPNNEYRNLPIDSTPLDYAFDIHTDLGYKYIAAKVNGKIVPIRYRLKSGDRVEILTSKHHKPSAEWLSFVVTQKAKAAILKYIKEDEKKNIEYGKEIWNKKLEQYNLQINQVHFMAMLREMNFKTQEDFYKTLATTDFNLTKAFQVIRSKLYSDVVHGNNNGNHNNVHNTKRTKYKIYPSKSGNYKFMITATDRQNIINDIMNTFFEFKDLQLDGFSYELSENIVHAKVGLMVISDTQLLNLLDKINEINGIQNIENLN